MSLWVCNIHGLYGGQVFCPKCGASGAYAILDERELKQSFASAGATGRPATATTPLKEKE
jgi:hypothetical protein